MFVCFFVFIGLIGGIKFNRNYQNFTRDYNTYGYGLIANKDTHKSFEYYSLYQFYLCLEKEHLYPIVYSLL